MCRPSRQTAPGQGRRSSREPAPRARRNPCSCPRPCSNPRGGGPCSAYGRRRSRRSPRAGNTRRSPARRQSKVLLLAGWNRDEGSYRDFFGHEEPVLANYVALARARFGARADTFLRLYSASTDAEARRAAQDFMGDQGAGFATWKWIESQLSTGGAPVFRYEFDQT